MDSEKQQIGFTLIEVLVAMTIVAVLASLSLVSYQGARKTARDGQRKADLEVIRSALETCRADTGSYPDSIYDNVSCGTPPRTYLSGSPKDPVTQANYSYSKTDSGYSLCATLEIDGSHCRSNP